MQNFRITLLFMLSSLGFVGLSHGSTDSEAWVPAVVFFLLDDSPTVPVKLANRRYLWDDYSLELGTDINGQQSLQWQTMPNIHHYLVEYRTDNGVWQQYSTTDPNIELPEGLVSNVEFRVIGCQTELLCSDYSNALSVVILAENNTQELPNYFYVPANIPAGEPFAIVWRQESDAEAFEIEQKNMDSGEIKSVFTGAPEIINGNHELLLPSLSNGNYCFRLKTKTNGLFSDYSTALCSNVGEPTLQSPAGITAQETDTGYYQISWQPVPEASSYKLERKTVVAAPVAAAKAFKASAKSVSSQTIAKTSKADATTLNWETVASGDITNSLQTHTIDTFDQNGLQNYRVSACNNSQNCGETSEISYTLTTEQIVDGIPQNITPTQQSSNHIDLDWSPVPGASNYEMEMKREGSSLVVQYPNIQSTSFSVNVLSGNYHFRVKACIGSGFCGDYDDVVEFLVEVQTVAASTPQLFYLPENTQPNSFVDISWKAPELQGVLRYEVQGELKNIIEDRIFTPDTDGYFHLQRPASAAGRKYCYKVRAWYSAGPGDFTQTLCTVVGELAFDAPTNISIEQTATQDFNVSWDPVAGASHYLLELQISASQWQAVQYSSATVKALQFNSVHYDIYTQLGHIAYRVSACDQSEYCGNFERVYYRGLNSEAFVDAPSESQKIPACLLVPEQVNQGEYINISWCAAETEVQGYELVGELKNTIAAGDFSSFATSAQGLYTVVRPPLPGGREYCYKVRALLNDGAVGDYTDTRCVIVGNIVFDAPVQMLSEHVPDTNDDYDIAWTPVNGSDHYLFEQQVSAGEWTPLDCSIGSITLSSGNFVGCRVSLSRLDAFPEIGKVGFRVSACNASGQCGNYQRHYFKLNLPPSVSQFEWLPSVVKVGQPTTFHWKIDNIQACFAPNTTTAERLEQGQSGPWAYYDVGEHISQWYCTDLYGNRFPETDFLEATRIVEKLSAPENIQEIME
jgi:hypothetical protein